ncbi:hypothetical protein A2555_02820 [Candidatus Falkowbacteria bacterium RIFOXYD2_FULL_39_16]|nr:MAG: hypothetical protein A2555_02820 [Candidatus Falkowbacteria bacterium RIFOXYD2_FULL_39_16]
MDNEVQIENIPKKKWYKRGWGISVIILGSLLLVLLVYFFAHFFYYYNGIKNGKIPLPGANNIKTGIENSTTVKIDDTAKLFHEGEPGTEDKAPFSIVGFFDFRCPLCIGVSSTVRELQQTYKGKIQFVFRNFPVVSLHPDAMLLAQAGECANLQNKFWPMYDKIFLNKSKDKISSEDLSSYAEQIGIDANKFSECLSSDKTKSLILEDTSDAEDLGVRGTPTWFIGNQKVEGPLSGNDFKKIIDKLLSEAEKK